MAIRRVVERRDAGQSNGKWRNTGVRSIDFSFLFSSRLKVRMRDECVWALILRYSNAFVWLVQEDTHHRGHTQVLGQRLSSGTRSRRRTKRFSQGSQHRNVSHSAAGNDLR